MIVTAPSTTNIVLSFIELEVLLSLLNLRKSGRDDCILRDYLDATDLDAVLLEGNDVTYSKSTEFQSPTLALVFPSPCSRRL